LDGTPKSFPKFNATGHSLLIKFIAPDEEKETTAYLKLCITALNNYPFNDVHDSDLVRRRIRNAQEKLMGISFRRHDRLKPDVVCGVLGKVIQSNARFGLSDRLEVHLDHVRMPAREGKKAVLSEIKKSTVINAAFLCLFHARIIAMARVNGDPKYKLYRKSRGLKQPVEDLLHASGVNLLNAGGFNEVEQFQNYLSDYKIIVYDGLSPDRVIFSGNSRSKKILYLLYDSNSEHCTVIPNIKTAMAKKYTYVMRVTHYTIHTNVTKLATCVRLHHPVRKMRQSIVLHATGGF